MNTVKVWLFALMMAFLPEYCEFDDEGKAHQLMKCPLLSIPNLDIIRDVRDSMHLVHLGVCKRLLEFITADSKSCRCKGSLTVSLREELGDGLGDLNGLLPTEFARQPRHMSYMKFFKATEFRSFLLYTGVVVLRHVLGTGQYEHFLALSVACRLLSEADSQKRSKNVTLSKRLLISFVKLARRYYGKKFLVYNVHNLIHIADDVERFGLSLTELSAFPFENYLQTLKGYVRGRRNPLSEIIRRREEFQSAHLTKPKHERQFKVLPNGRDSVFEVDGGVVFVRRTAHMQQTFLCDFFPWRLMDNFYEKPVLSMSVGTYFLQSGLSAKRIVLHQSLLNRKLVCVPYKDRGYVLTALLHDIN